MFLSCLSNFFFRSGRQLGPERILNWLANSYRLPHQRHDAVQVTVDELEKPHPLLQRSLPRLACRGCLSGSVAPPPSCMVGLS